MTGKVLVTGGAGFIGSHLCESLCRQGRSVVVLDDLSTGSADNLQGLPVELIRGSVADPAAVQRAMTGVDKVVHLAALPSVARSVDRPLDTHHACATGTATVLLAAKDQGARVVYAGSSSAYGDQEVLQKHEGLREDPLSPYAAAKLAGELYCRSFARVFGLRVVVTRFFNVFGPRQPANSPYSGVIAAFSRALLDGRAVRIDGDGLQARDFTYVEDVVGGVVRCLDADSSGCETVNLAYGQSTTVQDVYRTLCTLLQEAIGPIPIAAPIHAPARKGDVRHSLADTSRAKTRFGFAPTVGFAEGLRRTFDWYRRQSGKSSSP
ncbi:MAG: NAD-dependent epimerase/dehydratase family protein [Planctomycetes bacterium]|nr:NAD-dependent epimerase/dehydratase family protein [Planctomycetota bacterium]